MFDDQDRCEWVNSCSCTGTPGSPRQRAVKRCVCVCVLSQFMESYSTFDNCAHRGRWHFYIFCYTSWLCIDKILQFISGG